MSIYKYERLLFSPNFYFILFQKTYHLIQIYAKIHHKVEFSIESDFIFIKTTFFLHY